MKYKAIVDFGCSVLYLTNKDTQYTIPVIQGMQQQVPSTSLLNDASSISNNLTISAPSNISIPVRSVQFITGKLNAPCNVISGLVDPLMRSLAHICVACSLSPLANGNNILLQMMNISPTPVTIYSEGANFYSSTLYSYKRASNQTTT